MAEPNLWLKFPDLDASIASLPNELHENLKRQEATIRCTEWLKRRHPVESFRDSAGEAVFHWDMVGMALGKQNRLFEAIAVHRELYEQLCAAQEDYQWIHKGTPLVRLRDWHLFLGHPWHEERYLLLTLVEDAIREQGKITVEEGGIYHRFRWQDGRSDQEFHSFAERSWSTFSGNTDLHEFPEEILGRTGSKHFKRAAAPSEVDLYEINTSYASKLLERSRKDDWRALERLAMYELSCVPGFEVEGQKRSEASIFDAFVRIRGTYVDFRRELGAYILAECKNWKDPVGPDVIAYLAQNLAFHQCVAGILFSKNGITGVNEMKFGALTVLRAYHHSGRIILVLDEEDFSRASRGEPLQERLREKYEQVRFDLPSTT